MARHFSDWLKAYMDYTRASESPDQFHFWTGVATVAGALRRRVWISQNIFDWVPNFYIVLVGPPGVAAKSTTLDLGMDLLREIDGINFGSESGSWQKLAKSLEGAVEYIDCTMPDGMVVKLPMSCLTIPVSELGTFLKMNDDSYVSALISLWDGRRDFKHDTLTGGTTDIKYPWLNMIGATTPSWLESNFPENAIGGGLTSRILFVYGERKRHLVAYPGRIKLRSDHLKMRQQLIDDLQQIASLCGEYVLDQKAEIWGIEWYQKHWSGVPTHMASDRYGGYRSRKQTHIHKLAMVLAASRSGKLVITEQELRDADALVTELEQDMLRVFESIGVVDEAKYLGSILTFVRAYKWIDGHSLRRLTYNTIPDKEFKAACQAGLDAGLIAIEFREVGGVSMRGLRALPPPNEQLSLGLE